MATWHPMALTDAYQLSDRYLLDDGRVFLSGSQALARFPLEQLRADRRAGHRTSAYVTGYPGSPLANYDRDIASAAALAAADGYQLVARPAMNEELGATAVMGSQLTSTLPTATVDGVIGIWYGKGPGLDRGGDALRHANFAGTSALGGAVALVGDDPNAKSSTIPSAVTTTIVDLLMPLLYPGDVQEAIDLGRHAIALSRASGLWSAMRIVESVADGSGSVELHPERFRPVVPVFEVDGRQWTPKPSGRILTPDSLAMEREMHHVRLEIARRYAVENHLNSATVSGPDDVIGIVASGYSYLETREALRALGLRTDDEIRSAGIRLIRLSMPWPLDADHLRRLTHGLREVVVVEDKAPLVTWLLKDALYSSAERPEINDRVFPAHGALDADTIAAGLRTRLAPRLGDRLAPPPPAPRALIPLSVTRSPYFCSGCPHNTGTRTPEGALIGGGIGCHSMVMLMEPERVGNIVGLTSMGNEGSQWFGMTEFVSDHHIIQNIGDGTLFHSGMTAIRAGIASGTNITYKILYNGTVAMTGGQDAFGQVDVLQLARILMAEGAKSVIVTTDELSRYRSADMPAGLRVWGRHRIVEAQEVLAAIEGCTILIHDQRCAAEKRRDRKRSRIPAPGTKVVINERVCEGCGDCGDVSNCLSVQPVDTPFGRKTRIDQASCNHDLSCLDGDCPSFMLVKNPRTRPAPARRVEPPSVPLPTASAFPADGITVRLGGIGGTGVVTVSQVLGTAAMLQGLHVRGLDQTGLSQKAGPVVSDIVVTADAPSPANRARAASV
ncbi:MAG: indolepyruvate ferredoxin oxidoreductase family protein, partial [Ilumatobacteraceae bacterium]